MLVHTKWLRNIGTEWLQNIPKIIFPKPSTIYKSWGVWYEKIYHLAAHFEKLNLIILAIFSRAPK
jgi:hypothetical protein